MRRNRWLVDLAAVTFGCLTTGAAQDRQGGAAQRPMALVGGMLIDGLVLRFGTAWS